MAESVRPQQRVRLARLGESSIGTLLAKSLDKGGDSSEKRLDALRTATREAATFRATRSSTSSPPSVERTTDDAATFTIRDEIQAAARTTSQAKRNVDVGVSLVATADSALTELTRITKELKTLAEQAADTSTLASRRRALDREAQALKSEYARIIETTEFNGERILKAEFQGVRLKAASKSGGDITLSLPGKIGTGEFNLEPNTSLGTRSFFSGVTGDFNRDGRLDLARAESSSSGGIRVSFGDGFGGFTSSTLFATDSGSQAVQTADFNGDGNSDLVGVNTTANTVSVLLGDGDGGFQAALSYATGSNPQDVAIGDLNGDKILDLAVANYGDYTTSILFGKRGGSFDSQTPISSLTGARYIKVADINQDGAVDIVRSAYGGGSVYINLNNGSGQFSAESEYNSFSNTITSLLVEDINGDGAPDVVGSTVFYGTLEALVSNRVGGFTESTLGLTGSVLPVNLGAADFNADGKVDLLLSDFGRSLQLWEGTASGSFNLATTFSIYESPLAIADFNGDGVLDIAGSSTIGLGSTANGTAPLLDFYLETLVDARQAVTQSTQKLEQLSIQKAAVEGFKSRLASASRSLESQTNELLVAQDRIDNVSTAQDSARALRLSVINDATNAIRAQGLLQPDIALRLLA